MTGGLDGAYARYMAAVRQGDRRAAYAVLDETLAEGCALSDIYLHVLQPALREVGALWQRNEMTVADEHLATAITQGAMARAFDRVYAWTEPMGCTLIAACTEDERHEVGLRMLCDLLELRGWDTTFLGATVPVGSLVAMVGMRRPDVLALSAAIAPHLPRLRLTIQQVRAVVQPAPLIIVGGRPFLENPELALELGADLTATDPVLAATALEQRLGRAA